MEDYYKKGREVFYTSCVHEDSSCLFENTFIYAVRSSLRALMSI